MDNPRRKPDVTRRETLKLATAASALGLSLGFVFDGKDASGQVLKGLTSVKIDAAKLGTVSIKLYALNADGKNFDMVNALDITSLATRAGKGGENVISVKMYNQRPGEDATVLAAHELHIAQPSK